MSLPDASWAQGRDRKSCRECSAEIRLEVFCFFSQDVPAPLQKSTEVFQST